MPLIHPSAGHAYSPPSLHVGTATMVLGCGNVQRKSTHPIVHHSFSLIPIPSFHIHLSVSNECNNVLYTPPAVSYVLLGIVARGSSCLFLPCNTLSTPFLSQLLVRCEDGRRRVTNRVWSCNEWGIFTGDVKQRSRIQAVRHSPDIRCSH